MFGRRGLHRGGRDRAGGCRGDAKAIGFTADEATAVVSDSGGGLLLDGSRRRGELRDDEEVVGADHQDDQADGQDRFLSMCTSTERVSEPVLPAGWK